MIQKNWIINISVITIIILSTLTFFSPVEAQGVRDITHYVGGNGTGNYSSIQDAIDNATYEDIIYVYRGTYQENLFVNKKISLVGEDRNSTIIDGGGTGIVINITANCVHISHLTIQNSGRGIDAGIKIEESAGINISYCTFLNNYYGIWVYQSHSNTLYKCYIHHNYYGVMLHLVSHDNQVIFCTVKDNENTGIYLCCSSIRNNIIGCDIISNWNYGIDIHVWDTRVYLNNFLSNGVNARSSYSNVWNTRYPDGGNYWLDYGGNDSYQGHNQDCSGADGIGDTSYSISDKNFDRYPLMFPWTGKGDLDGDCDIDILDLDGFAQTWGGDISDPCYLTRCDFDNDLYIGILDLDGFAQMWGKTYC